MKTKRDLKHLISLTMSMETPYNILENLRQHIDIAWEDGTMDKILYENLQSKIFDNKIPGFKVIPSWNFTDDPKKQCILDAEPDFVTYAITFDSLDQEPTIDYIYKLLLAIMLSDCSGCCNALEFININKYGIFSKGDVSDTYHS